MIFLKSWYSYWKQKCKFIKLITILTFYVNSFSIKLWIFVRVFLITGRIPRFIKTPYIFSSNYYSNTREFYKYIWGTHTSSTKEFIIFTIGCWKIYSSILQKFWNTRVVFARAFNKGSYGFIMTCVTMMAYIRLYNWYNLLNQTFFHLNQKAQWFEKKNHSSESLFFADEFFFF
jgi:hypothetical protein